MGIIISKCEHTAQRLPEVTEPQDLHLLLVCWQPDVSHCNVLRFAVQVAKILSSFIRKFAFTEEQGGQVVVGKAFVQVAFHLKHTKNNNVYQLITCHN